MRGRAALLLAALLVALGANGCGHKEPPMPPRAPEPARPRVSFAAEGEALRLTWLFPASAPQPEAFRVLRAGPDESCPDCPPRYEERGLVYAHAGPEPYEIRDQGLVPGAAYAYTVMPLFPRGVEGPPSEPVRLVWRAALPPTGLVAVGTPAGVRLFWDTQLGAKGYALWRAEVVGGMAGPLERLGEVELPPYLDAAVSPGCLYRYAVATIAQAGEGPPSAPVEVTAPER